MANQEERPSFILTMPADADHDTVGDAIVRARAARGLSTDDLAQRLNIRRVYVEALEQNRFENLPPGYVYAAGFIRSIANYLDHDVDAWLALYKKQTGAAPPNPVADARKQPQFPTALEPYGAPKGRWVAAGLVFAFILTIALYFYERGASHAPDVVIAPPAETAPQAEPAPQAPSPAPAAPNAPEVAAPQLETPAPAPPAPTVPPSGARVILVAQEASWVQITNRAGRVIDDRTLQPNEVFEIPPGAGLRLTVGNAGGVTLVLDGQPLPPLGARAQVRRNIMLDPEALATLR